MNRGGDRHLRFSSEPAILTPGRTPELRRLDQAQRAFVGTARLAQGPVMATARQVVDSVGMIGSPLVALSILAALERRGRITGRQRQAGETFHQNFRAAALDNLKAADMGRVAQPVGGGAPTSFGGNERARRRIRQAMRLLGGEAALPASCAWHVLGLEWSLRQWAIKALRGNAHEAAGVLVATLAVIEPYFGA